jgi:S-adenosylmethionine:tRNA ribosyltransferase-isomerase
MIPESRAIQRPPEARLLAVDHRGRMRVLPRADFVTLLRNGDLVVANDAATLPASLHGIHVPSGAVVEVRLAGWPSAILDDPRHFYAIVFGAGDYRQRTEDRPPPPVLQPGDCLALGPLSARIEALLGHPRFASLRFDGTPDAIWAGLASHGRPIQYAHIPAPLALWDVWTPIAGPPVAFEPPSAGFVLGWQNLALMRSRGIHFATLTHAAGISSTGDPELDKLLPLDEPYSIPGATAAAVNAARARGARVVAIGTTVVRALEAAATGDGIVRSGSSVATARIDCETKLRVVDAILTGTHEPGTSHHALLGAFLDETSLCRTDAELDRGCYRTHEFGDSLFIERGAARRAASRSRCPHPAWSGVVAAGEFSVARAGGLVSFDLPSRPRSGVNGSGSR